MKKLFSTITAIALFSTLSIAQNRTLPSVNVKTLDGGNMNITALENDGNPIVISFWATWCKPCKKELNNISEVYEDWQDETGVKLVAISIDDTRSMKKVMPYVNASDWDYEVYLDPNGDLKRAMGVSTVPHTFLLNDKNEIVWQHKGYVDGDEDELLEQIEKFSK
ncbi:MAG: TlpA family protein disulfide reductase [Flavobacteriales bacterium]|jgi:thiol-disulfide isomerase/thioredoxin|nr:TlpA family protein disulfide reductase [Flavobacteriales bacterium]MBT4881887.1 TlpA family protein disulfide reductase [Flavobacteriales bacterium]|tara:strand:+ start:15477 stop:15971 length:495 start_codon:yes stop_codon:yes gene_type:complete